MDTRCPARFTKMQGIGNDFVLIESGDSSGTDWPAFARRVCDRRFAVGSDGLLVVEASTVAAARMRMFNPDGTEDMCGNGLRCVARYVAERGLAYADCGLRIETLVGIRECTVAY